MPEITVEEAELIRQLPAVRDVNVGEYTEGPVSAQGVDLTDVKIAGFGWSWPQVNGGDILAGRNFTAIEYAAGARVAVINDKLAESLFPGLDPIGKQIKIYGVPFNVVGCTPRRRRCSPTRTSPGSPSRIPPSARWPSTGPAGWRSR